MSGQHVKLACALLGAGGALLGQLLWARWHYRALARRRRKRLPYFLSAACAEAERMRAAQPYDVREETVAAIMREAHAICEEHNAQPLGARPRASIIRDLFGSVGAAFQIEAPIFCDVGAHIYVGDNFFANAGCCLLDVAEIRIGHNVFFAPNVQLYTATHPLDHLERRSAESGRPIVIGDDVWIGGNAVVLPGVRIGSRCVVGAGSVVTKDVPSDVVVAGNPARVIRQLVPPSW